MTIHASANKYAGPVRLRLSPTNKIQPPPQTQPNPTQTVVLSPGAIGTLSLTQISHRSPAW